MDTTSKSNHIGRKISRLRELKGLKQEAMAIELGISQQAISRIEQSVEIEDEVLERIAKVLGLTPEAVKNFNEEAVFNFFNTFNDNSMQNQSGYYSCTFNPLDKLVEMMEKNEQLYERLLQSEREKVELLKGK